MAPTTTTGLWVARAPSTARSWADWLSGVPPGGAADPYHTRGRALTPTPADVVVVVVPPSKYLGADYIQSDRPNLKPLCIVSRPSGNYDIHTEILNMHLGHLCDTTRINSRYIQGIIENVYAVYPKAIKETKDDPKTLWRNPDARQIGTQWCAHYQRRCRSHGQEYLNLPLHASPNNQIN